MKIIQILRGIRDSFKVDEYSLRPFLVEDAQEHPFALICPGGGYSMVCCSGEGDPFAAELNKRGYHAFVLTYGTKKKARYPQPQLDVKRAVEEIFAHAEEWRLDKSSWSLWGSSAGGHLAASFCTEQWGTPKPSALILCYPVITMGESTHKGSRRNHLGRKAKAEMIKKLSVEKNIGSDYPPTFVWYGTADGTVDPVNAKALCDALEKAGVVHRSAEYEGIGHGVGLAENTAAEGWFDKAVSFWESLS